MKRTKVRGYYRIIRIKLLLSFKDKRGRIIKIPATKGVRRWIKPYWRKRNFSGGATE